MKRCSEKYTLKQQGNTALTKRVKYSRVRVGLKARVGNGHYYTACTGLTSLAIVEIVYQPLEKAKKKKKKKNQKTIYTSSKQFNFWIHSYINQMNVYIGTPGDMGFLGNSSGKESA